MQPMQEDEDKLREIQVTVARKYPGRGWDDLSEMERNAVLGDVGISRDYAAAVFNTELPGVERVGRVAAANHWNAAANAFNKALGGYMLGEARKEDRLGRQAAADLLERRDAIDAVQREREEEEERRRRESLYSLFARG